MKRTIYIDSYLVTCFFLHYYCLSIVPSVNVMDERGKRGRRLRILTAACVVTATDGCLLLFSAFSHPFVLIVVIAAEMVIAAIIAYGIHGALWNAVLLLFVTALLAGMMYALRVQHAAIVCLVSCIGSYLIDRGWQRLLFFQRTRSNEMTVALRFDGEEQRMVGFLDSGNRLRMYGTRLPVVVVDERLLLDWWERASLLCPQKLVTLPFHAVGGNGLMKGVRARLSIDGEGSAIEVAAVGADHALFFGKTYRMLLQPEVFQKQKEGD